ncbi:unnamed protein product [Rhodiola kirilowii]
MQTVKLHRACGAYIEATNQKLLLFRAKSTVDEVELGLRLSNHLSTPQIHKFCGGLKLGVCEDGDGL